MIYKLRDFLSRTISAIQIKWMEQYGYFEKHQYIVTKSVPTWVNQAQRKMGYLAMSLDPREIQLTEINLKDS